MKNTLLFPFLFSVIMSLPASAKELYDDEPQCLVVWFTDGSKIYHDLEDLPTTTFRNGVLNLTTLKESISYPLEKVLRYTYEENLPSVGVNSVNGGEAYFSLYNETMIFEGLPAGTVLEIFSPNGKLILTQRASKGHPAIISLAGIPDGTYIVKFGDTSFKFIKNK